MLLIKQIEIIKFRSILREKILLDEIVVFSGKNNSGKSNILRALNLFFNSESSFGQRYLHRRDYNQAYTGRAGGKREIVIKILFYPHGEGALNREFYISRRADEGGLSDFEYSYPGDRSSITDGNLRKQFTRFRNKIRYFYVPAVRDRAFVQELFLYFESLLEEKTETDNNFKNHLAKLSEILGQKSLKIGEDFEKFINLGTTAELSSNITDILGSTRVQVKSGIKVKTKSKERPTIDVNIDLFSSGDGILMSYIPHFLHYISKSLTNKYFIWGFEEPENSLEFSKAALLADKFNQSFKKDAQILLTSHSPAFINLGEKDGNRLYRVYIRPDDPAQTSAISLVDQLYEKQQNLFEKGQTETDEFKMLQNELGMHLMNEDLFRRYKHEKDELSDLLSYMTKPIVISEGNNVEYLKKAKEFFDPEGQYEIQDGTSREKMKTLFEYFSSNLPKSKVAFVWDPDYASSVNCMLKTQQLLPLALVPLIGRSDKVGIEGLFDDKWFTSDVIMKDDGNLPGLGSMRLDKKGFLQKLLRNGVESDFEQFRSTFNLLKKFFA